MTSHDPIRQLKYLRQTLSQNKKSLGFFLAAGCPLAVPMPEGMWPLIPDIAGLTKFVSDELKSKDQKLAPYDVLLEELVKSGNSNPNIEDILSFVRNLKQVSAGADQIRGLTEKELNELESQISKKIVEKTKVELPSRSSPYHQLAQWIQLIDRDDCPIECFTTNYDLLLEQAFEDTGVAYFDGFVGSRRPFFDLRAIEDSLIPQHWTRLWKVHGSINWFLNSRQEVYRSSGQVSDDSYLIHPSHLKYDQSRKMPYLALIDRLKAFLRQTSPVLITAGYSFGDTHLNDTIVNALRANPNAMVIALLYGTATLPKEGGGDILRYEQAFSYAKDRLNLSTWTFDEAIIGGQRGIWQAPSIKIGEADNLAGVITPIFEKRVDANGDEDEVFLQHHMMLGDFGKFGSFLQALAGDDQLRPADAK